MNRRPILFLSGIAAFTLFLTACGGHSSTPPPTITVTLSGQPTSLTTGATASITATVSNGAGVTWSVTCATAPCGTFSPTSTTSGAATTYTAPSAPTSVTITATTSSGTSASASATITITAPPPSITVALNPTPLTSLVTGTTTSLTAVVSNDSQNKGVTWTITCASTGTGACGSLSTTTTASGAATTYTAPTAVPTSNTVKITATSVTDTTKSASVTITIAPVLANGTYVYHLAGYDTNGPDFFAGAFTVASGVITGGEQDFSNPKAGYTNPLIAANCALSVAGKNIQIVLATSNTNLGANGVETLRGTVVSASRVLITELDTFGTGSGSIDLQTTPVAAPSGGYAFVVSGWNIGTSPSPFGIGGILNVSGTNISVTGSVFDYNLGGNTAQSLLFTSPSTVSAPDSFGRVSFSLTPAPTTPNVPAFILTGYIVNPSQIQLVESQQDALGDDLGGMALGQGPNTGQFTLASLANKTYVYAVSGQDVNGLSTIAGALTFGTAGSISGSLALNDIATFVKDTVNGGTLTVDPTGRATLTGVAAQTLKANFTFQLYLDGNGNAMMLGVDNLQQTAGPAYLQATTQADFEGSYALAGYGFLKATGSPAWGAVGPVTVASDSFTGSTDYSAQASTPVSAQSLTGSEINSTGILSLTGLDSSSFTSVRSYAYFPIDSRRVFAVEIDGNQLGLLSLEGVSH